MAALGMTAAAIDTEMAKRPVVASEPVELEEGDEGEAAALFLALDTQWNFTSTGMVQGNGGYGVRTGLKYETIAPVAAMLGLPANRQCLIDLRIMEAEALATFAVSRR